MKCGNFCSDVEFEVTLECFVAHFRLLRAFEAVELLVEL